MKIAVMFVDDGRELTNDFYLQNEKSETADMFVRTTFLAQYARLVSDSMDRPDGTECIILENVQVLSPADNADPTTVVQPVTIQVLCVQNCDNDMDKAVATYKNVFQAAETINCESLYIGTLNAEEANDAYEMSGKAIARALEACPYSNTITVNVSQLHKPLDFSTPFVRVLAGVGSVSIENAFSG